MLPIFDGNGDRIAYTYNGVSFNQYVDDSKKDIIEVNFAQVRSIIEQTSERAEFSDGLEAYGAYKRAKRLLLSGVVRASTKGALYDRLEEFAAAVDPSTLSRDNPDDFGFLALDFDVPTADTATWATGVIPSRYYVRAEEAFEPPSRLKQGLAIPWRLSFLAPDPRRYAQSTEQLTGAGTADNAKGTFYSWPTLTIAMTGAGSGTFAIANTTAGQTLTLDFSGRSNGQSVSVDMVRETIKVDGTDAPDLYVSGNWFWIEPGSNTITVTNGTNASATLTWRPAFSF